MPLVPGRGGGSPGARRRRAAGKGKGAKGGAKVVVEPHRHEGVFVARGKEDVLVATNTHRMHVKVTDSRSYPGLPCPYVMHLAGGAIAGARLRMAGGGASVPRLGSARRGWNGCLGKMPGLGQRRVASACHVVAGARAWGMGRMDAGEGGSWRVGEREARSGSWVWRAR